jgi:Bacterial membrane protein YfhO
MWLSRGRVRAEPQLGLPRDAVHEVSARKPHSPRHLAPRKASHWGDVLGLGWVVLVLGAYLSPALWDGFSFGPTDIANQLSFLTYTPHVAVHNVLNGDVITQAVPWNTLDWLAAHHGQLPLWNNYSGDGMPLMLNFESAALALPTLAGYLFPLGASFLVGIAVSLFIAGSGTYVAARLAGVGPLGAALAGTTFMLSGSLSGWAGWAVSGPFTWAGWLLAGALLCYQAGRRRWAGVVVVSVSSGFAVYEGFPESLLFLGIAVGTTVLVAGVLAGFRGKRNVSGPVCLVAGVSGGAALSAPLWLPGLAVLHQSSRATENGTGGLPVHALALLFAQGYDGLPINGGTWFGPADYYEATAYVGVIAIVLALVAVLVAWRRPLVAGLVATVFVCLGIIYVPASQRMFTRLGAGSVATQRLLPMLAFAVALLAGMGTEIVQRRWRQPRDQLKALAAIVGCGAVLAYMVGPAAARGLTPAQLSERRHALFWPTLSLIGVASVLLLAYLASRRARLESAPLATYAGPPGPGPDVAWPPAVEPDIGAPGGNGLGGHGQSRNELTARLPAGGSPGMRIAFTRRAAGGACLLLLAAQSAYLVWAGIGINSYASSPFPVTAAVAKLQRLVGDNLVALDGTNKHDVTLWTGVGLYPEVNIGYGIRELAIHDPVIPPAYFQTWPSQQSIVNAGLGNNIFVPAVGSATRARFYGASFILASPGSVPKNTQYVTKFTVPLAGSLYLYRVPGAAQFSFSPGSGALVVSAEQTGNASWRLAVDVPRSSALTLRLTYFPGWHVSADGRALTVHEAGGLLLGATVPAGTRTVTVSYWPDGLTTGFALALAAIAVLSIGSALVIASPSRLRSIFSLTTREDPPGGMLTP